MTNIEITGVAGKKLLFKVSIDGISEKDVIELDNDTLHWIRTVLEERPFKKTTNEVYSWKVLETGESNKDSKKELTIEIHRGKSRVKRSALVSKEVFLKFWNIMHYQKLPSEQGNKQRVN